MKTECETLKNHQIWHKIGKQWRKASFNLPCPPFKKFSKRCCNNCCMKMRICSFFSGQTLSNPPSMENFSKKHTHRKAFKREVNQFAFFPEWKPPRSIRRPCKKYIYKTNYISYDICLDVRNEKIIEKIIVQNNN